MNDNLKDAGGIELLNETLSDKIEIFPSLNVDNHFFLFVFLKEENISKKTGSADGVGPVGFESLKTQALTISLFVPLDQLAIQQLKLLLVHIWNKILKIWTNRKI